jgi:hypothetical protein
MRTFTECQLQLPPKKPSENVMQPPRQDDCRG